MDETISACTDIHGKSEPGGQPPPQPLLPTETCAVCPAGEYGFIFDGSALF